MPYGIILNIIIIAAFVLAFIKAEMKGRIILAAIMGILILVPQVVPMMPASWLWWVHFLAKVIFGLCCLIYFKWAGLTD
jgi:hypothetical protein